MRRFADITGSSPVTTVNQRTAFYNWLYKFPANNGTPLRTAAQKAGALYSTTGNNSPYGVDPNQTTTVTGTEYACRPNFHIMMTDGLWNDSTGNFCGSSRCNNADGTGGLLTAGKLPDNTTYDTTSSLTRIYRDSSSDTLADVAFYYWSTDLRPDLQNKLIPYYADRTGTLAQQYWNPKNDPATWQHVVMFTVGLGLSQTLGGSNRWPDYFGLLPKRKRSMPTAICGL